MALEVAADLRAKLTEDPAGNGAPLDVVATYEGELDEGALERAGFEVTHVARHSRVVTGKIRPGTFRASDLESAGVVRLEDAGRGMRAL